MMRRLDAVVRGLCVWVVCLAWMNVHAEMPAPTDGEIAALIEQLGDAEYARRETAAARLDALGAAAIDPLLAAAESSEDLEVALRSRWLAESIPLAEADDTPEVVKLLDRYRKRAFDERVRVMHRLLRADDDAGVRALARILRLDRDPVAARIAAAILAREWQADTGDPYWPGMCDRIVAGLGTSSRPAAMFVRTVVEFSRSDDDAERVRLATTGLDLLAALQRPTAAGPPQPGAADQAGGHADDLAMTTQLIFERCVVQMLVGADRRDDALLLLRRQLETHSAAAHAQPIEDVDEQVGTVADVLVWSATHGVPEIVTAVPGIDAAIRGHIIVRYAAAICERARDREAEAQRLAQEAFAAGNDGFAARFQAAVLLVKWGAADWASREYASILADAGAPVGQRALATVTYSEFLHDQGREAEAAAALQRIVDGDRADGVNQQILQQIGRDPLATRARMHFFEACAAAARGDADGQRKALEQATATVARDVDALIALYALPDDSPDHRSNVMRMIKETLDRIEGGIEATPDDTSGYNEYAWLVANTEGDVAKATRYSRRSLAASPDNTSFLDTLAHCHAAAGHLPLAIRTQRLAQRLEPHNRIIRLNLERFERLAAGAATPVP
jgi:tetratricopeptide (TPR) repeat protein